MCASLLHTIGNILCAHFHKIVQRQNINTLYQNFYDFKTCNVTKDMLSLLREFFQGQEISNVLSHIC